MRSLATLLLVMASCGPTPQPEPATASPAPVAPASAPEAPTTPEPEPVPPATPEPAAEPDDPPVPAAEPAAPADPGPSPYAWAGAFYAYPGAVDLCHGHADHGSTRSFNEVHGTDDSRAAVLAFYDERYPGARNGHRYHASDADSRSYLTVLTRAEARKARTCRGAALDQRTIIVIDSEVRGEPPDLDLGL